MHHRSFDAQIGGLIRSCRMGRGMTQTALGEKVGVTFQQVQKYENGKNSLNIFRLFQMARAMEISPSWIISLLENTPACEAGTIQALPFEMLLALTEVKDQDDRQLLVALAKRLRGKAV